MLNLVSFAVLKDNKLLYPNDCGLKLISCNSFKAATERDLKNFFKQNIISIQFVNRYCIKAKR